MKKILQQGTLDIPQSDVSTHNPYTPDDEDDNDASPLVAPDEAKALRKEAIMKKGKKMKRPSEGSVHAPCVVQFESGGRFSAPETEWFEDYTSKNVTQLVMSRDDDLLDNICSVLDQAKEDKSYKAEDMLLEEFFEALVAIKKVYNGNTHTHRWLCQCQKLVPDEQKKMSGQDIDLSNIKFVIS